VQCRGTRNSAAELATLADGTYTLTVHGSHIFFGDTDGDSALHLADLAAYGSSLWYLDDDGDGTAGWSDWLAFRDRLPPF
jgi:hypothetical protein